MPRWRSSGAGSSGGRGEHEADGAGGIFGPSLATRWAASGVRFPALPGSPAQCTSNRARCTEHYRVLIAAQARAGLGYPKTVNVRPAGWPFAIKNQVGLDTS